MHRYHRIDAAIIDHQPPKPLKNPPKTLQKLLKTPKTSKNPQKPPKSSKLYKHRKLIGPDGLEN